MEPKDIELSLDQVQTPDSRGFKTPRGLHKWILIVVVGMMALVLLSEAIKGDREDSKKQEEERNEGTSKRAANIETPAPLEVLKSEVDQQVQEGSKGRDKPKPQQDLPPVPPGMSYPTGVPYQGSPTANVDQMKRNEQIYGSPLMAISESAMPASTMTAQQAQVEELKQRQYQAEKAARELVEREISNANKLVQDGQKGDAQLPLTRAEENMKWLEQQTSQSNPPIRPASISGPNVLARGTMIPSVTLMEISSDLPGNFTAMVSEDVYDTVTAKSLLIPKGSKLFGVYNSNVRMGQAKVMLAFTWLYLPSGAAVPLNGMQGADAMGVSGVPGEVDNQFMKMFGAAFAIGAIDRIANGRSSGVQVQGYGATSQGGMTQILVNTANQILERNRNIQPRVVIPQATKFNVIVSQDIQISPNLTRSTNTP